MYDIRFSKTNPVCIFRLAQSVFVIITSRCISSNNMAISRHNKKKTRVNGNKNQSINSRARTDS